jgi:hypothetical protein
VPAALAIGDNMISCLQFRSTVPASCVPNVAVRRGVVSATTYSGRYPPLYYAVVGLPSLVVTSRNASLFMRLIGDLLNSLMLGLAMTTAIVWSRNRQLTLGVLLAATPMSLYLAGMVNPNGLETTSAICLWVCIATFGLERPTDPPRGLVVVTGLSAAILTLSRGISPLWTLIAFGVLAGLYGPGQFLALVRRRLDVRLGLIVVALCGLFAVWWDLAEHALDVARIPPAVPPHSSDLHILVLALGQTEEWLRQMVGVFGSLDTAAPFATFLFWWVAGAATVIIALWLGHRRELLVLGSLLLASFVLPAVLDLPDARTHGLIWQGRYSLPMVSGLVIVASGVIGSHCSFAGLTLRLTRLVMAACAVASFLAFAEALRRYAVGTAGPIDFLGSRWQPTGGSIVDLVWFAVVATALSVWLYANARHRLRT